MQACKSYKDNKCEHGFVAFPACKTGNFKGEIYNPKPLCLDTDGDMLFRFHPTGKPIMKRD